MPNGIIERHLFPNNLLTCLPKEAARTHRHELITFSLNPKEGKMKTRIRTFITVGVTFLVVGMITSTAFSRGEGRFRKWAEWKKKVSFGASKKGHERQGVSKEDGRKMLFEKFDKDGDGELSHEERQNAAE
jgi:hypothetical protein